MQAARGASVTPDQQSDGSEPPEGAEVPPASRGRGRWIYVLVAVAGIGLDILTKQLAVSRLEPYTPVDVVGSLLRFHLIRNPGAAFSLGESFTPVFAILALAVLVFVLVRLVPRLGHRGWGVALGLLSAGVAGNLIDRIFRAPGFLHGHVVDFLQLPHWAIFNVADMCISAAAVLIIVLAIIRNVAIDGRRYVKPEKPAPTEPTDPTQPTA